MNGAECVVIYVTRNHRAHHQLETIANNTVCAGMFGAIAKLATIQSSFRSLQRQSSEVLCNLQFEPMQASDIIRSDWNGMKHQIRIAVVTYIVLAGSQHDFEYVFFDVRK